jgi:hypothetical protein
VGDNAPPPPPLPLLLWRLLRPLRDRNDVFFAPMMLLGTGEELRWRWLLLWSLPPLCEEESLIAESLLNVPSRVTRLPPPPPPLLAMVLGR